MCAIIFKLNVINLEDRVGNVPPPTSWLWTPEAFTRCTRYGFLSTLFRATPRNPAPVAPKVKIMSSSEKRLRVVNLKARCLQEEADVIREKAMDSGVSVSEFLRCAALGRKTRSTMDSQVINELRRLGGLQKHLFNESSGVHSKEFAEILAAIKDAILRIES